MGDIEEAALGCSDPGNAGLLIGSFPANWQGAKNANREIGVPRRA